MDDLIQEFIAETREMLEALEGEIVAWEADPANRPRLDAIFRFVHTVKGNCGFLDLPRLAALSHAAEGALAAVRGGGRVADAPLVSAVLAVIDRISELVAVLEETGTIPEGDDAALIESLDEAPVGEAAPVAEDSRAVAAPRAPARTVRLPLDLLDRMMSGVSDLVLARNELARRLRDSGVPGEVEAAFERVSSTLADVRDAVTRTRMQRLESLFGALPRMVRDLAAETGKPVALFVEGGEVEIDREMIEMIRDPLTHVVRNAVDHGIEPEAERRRSGKPATGRLCVSGRQAGNQILIEVADDGRGLDTDALAARAVASGLITEAQAMQLGDSQKAALVFEPGLSTAREVTALSGRGVGMDVVRANVERIGGSVEIDSRRGEGARITLRVPLTLTIIPALTLGVGDRTYAISRSSVDEIVRVKSVGVRVEAIGGAAAATVRGRRLPLLSLRRLLGDAAAPAAPGDGYLVLARARGEHCFALAVDEVHDHEELVVRPAAPPVTAAGIYAGTTIAEDGRPVLLLDSAGLAEAAGLALDGRESPAASNDPVKETREERADSLLFRTLCGALRLVPLGTVQRIEEAEPGCVAKTAGRLHVAVGEHVLPLAGCPDRPGGRFRLLRLSDGASEIAYAFDEVVDTVPTPERSLPSRAEGEVLGVALVGGEQVELLDLHWLFANVAAAGGAAADRPLCAVPSGDPFMDSILRPLIEGAGYRVVPSQSAEAERAELTIVASDAEAPPAAGRLLRLRPGPEPLHPDDDSIHRYDRAALIAALAAVPRKGAGRG